MILDREALLRELKLKTETVPVGTEEVTVTELTAAEFMDVIDSPLAKNEQGEMDGPKFSALLATRCIVDDSGKRLLADEDTDLLRQGSSSVYSTLVLAVKRLNGLAGDAVKN